MIYEIIKYGLLGIGGTLVTSYVIENEMKNVDTIVETPVDTVSIIVPTYNESEYIEKSLKSIKNQSIIQKYPEYFEIIVVDGNSSDGTPELSKPYVNKVLNVGSGKLTARNIATNVSRGNIIVAADGDSIYSKYWLNALLKPFKDPEVVATNGSVIDYSVNPLWGPIHTIVDYINYGVLKWSGLNGGNSAFLKKKFFEVGKFNENIDQLNFIAVSDEEEINLYYKLLKVGKIEFVLTAVKEHLGGSRVACRIGVKAKDECSNLGIGTIRF